MGELEPAAFPTRPRDEQDRPVTRLETLRHDDQLAVGGHPLPGDPAQLCARRLVEARQICRIKAEQDRGRDLVDVLPPRTARADKTSSISCSSSTIWSVTGIIRGPASALNTDHGLEGGDFARQPGAVRRLDHGSAVLVGPGCLLGDAAQRWALDDDAALAQFVRHLAAMPLFQRLVPAQPPAGASFQDPPKSVCRCQRSAPHHDPGDAQGLGCRTGRPSLTRQRWRVRGRCAPLRD